MYKTVAGTRSGSLDLKLACCSRRQRGCKIGSELLNSLSVMQISLCGCLNSIHRSRPGDMTSTKDLVWQR